MAGNLIDLNEAAEIIGVTPEELSALAASGKIRSFRAGASVRFKREELDAWLAEKSAGGDSELKLAPDSDSGIGLADNDSGEDSVLLSETELGGGSPSASTILRGDDSGASDIKVADDSGYSLADDSDMSLADDSDIDLGGEVGGGSGVDSDVNLVPDASGSGVNLVPGDSEVSLASDIYLGDSPGGSGVLGDSSAKDLFDKEKQKEAEVKNESSDLDLDLAADSGLPLAGADSDADLLSTEDSDVPVDSSDFDVAGSAITLDDSGDIELPEASDINLSGGSDVVIDDSGIELDADASGLGVGDSGLNLDISDIELGEEDDDLVLGGSEISSDLSLTGDSGINLQPSDSGLSLDEEPLELGGSDVDALELPEDDMVELEDDDVSQDGDFFLTPSEDADEDDESGSQVIALEESGYVDPDEATMLGAPSADAGFAQPGFEEAPVESGALVAQDDDMFRQPGEAPVAGGAGAAQPVAPAAAPQPVFATETPYSVFNVLGLLLVFVFVLASLLLMVDVVRNVWSFSEPYNATTFLMDSLVETLGMDP